MSRVYAALLTTLFTALLTAPAAAQEWRLGAQFGRVSYAGAAADAARASTLSLGLSRVGVTDWLGISAGVPLREDPVWGVAGVWKRWRSASSTGVGVDFTAHAFLQRDRTTRESRLPGLPGAETPERSGEGAGGELALLGFASVGKASLEARAGATAQTSRVSGMASQELLPFADARVLFDAGNVQFGPDAKLWFGDSAHGYVGVSAYGAAPGGLDLWASGGSWVQGGVSGLSLSAGGALPVSSAVRLEASYRSAAFDPLYGTETSSSVTLGASVRVGGSRGVSAPVPAQYENGRATIRLRARDVPGRPSIAGDFNNWTPQPMTSAGDAWTFTVRLEPGVYNYAFVNEAGEWFVPESVPGRRADGMGGHVAVLVVS